MRFRQVATLLLMILASCQRSESTHLSPVTVDQSKPAPIKPIEVYFSPRGGCTEAVLREINAAQKSIRIQAYAFTSTPIAKALLEAHKRGLDVDVILDKSQRSSKYSSADFMNNGGMTVWIDGQHAIAHNKVMILDERAVITGSFNFTAAAEESHAENLLVIHNPEIARQYIENWESHHQHSERYTGRPSLSTESAPADTPSVIAEPVVTVPNRKTMAEVVASKDSKVYHLPECGWVNKVHHNNLLHYATREDAEAVGKKPCSVCKP